MMCSTTTPVSTGTHERAVRSFEPVSAVLLAAHVLLLLAAQHQCAVLDRRLQGLAIHPGQFGRNAQCFAIVDDVNSRPESRRTEVASPAIKAAHARERIVEELPHRAPRVA